MNSGITMRMTGNTWLTRIHIIATGLSRDRNRPSAYAAGSATAMVSSIAATATTALLAAERSSPCACRARP